jgi:hypothetical protein
MPDNCAKAAFKASACLLWQAQLSANVRGCKNILVHALQLCKRSCQYVSLHGVLEILGESFGGCRDVRMYALQLCKSSCEGIWGCAPTGAPGVGGSSPCGPTQHGRDTDDDVLEGCQTGTSRPCNCPFCMVEPLFSQSASVILYVVLQPYSKHMCFVRNVIPPAIPRRCIYPCK